MHGIKSPGHGVRNYHGLQHKSLAEHGQKKVHGPLFALFLICNDQDLLPRGCQKASTGTATDRKESPRAAAE
jgi:hypothetical protein